MQVSDIFKIKVGNKVRPRSFGHTKIRGYAEELRLAHKGNVWFEVLGQFHDDEGVDMFRIQSWVKILDHEEDIANGFLKAVMKPSKQEVFDESVSDFINEKVLIYNFF